MTISEAAATIIGTSPLNEICEHALKDQRHGQHDEKEDREQRGELAGERDDRIAAGALEPGSRMLRRRNSEPTE